MMFDWQTYLSLLIVGVSFVILIRNLFQITKGTSSGCGSCSACPSKNQEQNQQLRVTPLVQIGDRTT